MLKPTLEKISVNVLVCPEIISGGESLANGNFDAVIIDCDDLLDGSRSAQGLRRHAE